MKNIYAVIASFLILGAQSFGAQALVIEIGSDPFKYTIDGGSLTDCANGTGLFTGGGTPGGACTYSSVNGGNDDAEFDFLSALSLAYKDDIASESGTLQNSYHTNLTNGANDTVISYDGGNAVDCGADCWLIVKDGNADPARYLFNLAMIGWNGTDDLDLRNFFSGKSISHVAIWGDISEIPVPAAVWLFGTALIGFVGMSRKVKV